MKAIALVLLALGVAGLVFGGIGFNRKRTILDVAGIKATTTERESIPIAPILGGVFLVGGIVLLVSERRRA